MKKLSIKQRILLLTILPILIIVIALMVVVQYKLSELGEQEISDIQHSMMEQKRSTLKNYVDIAVSSVQPFIDAARDSNDQVAQEAVKRQLRSVLFEANKDGYIFVYQYDGTNIVMRPKPILEGTNLIDFKDSNGVPLIRMLIDKAKSGGGYVKYMWTKPSKNSDAPKLSYAVAIEKFGWMIGTGFYIDDIDDAVNAARERINKQVDQTIWTIAGLCTTLSVIAFFLGLFVSRRITKSLRDTADALDDISQGEGDLTRRLKVYSDDEVGRVSQGFNLFVDKIQHLVIDIKSGVEDLCRSVNEMNNVVNKTNENVDRQRQETSQAADCA